MMGATNGRRFLAAADNVVTEAERSVIAELAGRIKQA